MKRMLTLAIVLFSQSLLASNCIKFNDKDFCEVWNNKDDGVHTVELLAEGQSLESWSTMITVRKYKGKTALKEVLPGYVNSVKPMFALKPDILQSDTSKAKEEVYFRMLLLAPDKSHYEYVINRFYRDDDESVKSIFYSHRIPFAEQVNFNEIMENRDSWLEQLQSQNIDGHLGE
ncbi:hypothetical protein [Motilimonas eburnea]|uniref:hypothetical protein n=1 Tax=Motilimonas eburnea TaxID=1737488 RepID=UPI001E3DBAAF|nr:hypothetical protein [Motilimonas eburnea]MCE2573907.1 hypothetical protein [Motilimonas eburnea]